MSLVWISLLVSVAGFSYDNCPIGTKLMPNFTTYCYKEMYLASFDEATSFCLYQNRGYLPVLNSYLNSGFNADALLAQCHNEEQHNSDLFLGIWNNTWMGVDPVVWNAYAENQTEPITSPTVLRRNDSDIERNWHRVLANATIFCLFKPVSHCSFDYDVFLPGKCIKVIENATENQISSNFFCTNGGTLMVIRSAAENEFLFSYMKSYNQQILNESFWIKDIWLGYEIQNGTGIWPDGRASNYTNFIEDEPGRNCTIMIIEGAKASKWKFVSCTNYQSQFVCQLPLFVWLDHIWLMTSFKVFFLVSTLVLAAAVESRVKRQLPSTSGIVDPLQEVVSNLTDVLQAIGKLLDGTLTLPQSLTEILNDLNNILEGVLATVNRVVESLLGSTPLGNLLTGVLSNLTQVESNLVDAIKTLGKLLDGSMNLPTAVQEILNDIDGILGGVLGTVQGLLTNLLLALLGPGGILTGILGNLLSGGLLGGLLGGV